MTPLNAYTYLTAQTQLNKTGTTPLFDTLVLIFIIVAILLVLRDVFRNKEIKNTHTNYYALGVFSALGVLTFILAFI